MADWIVHVAVGADWITRPAMEPDVQAYLVAGSADPDPCGEVAVSCSPSGSHSISPRRANSCSQPLMGQNPQRSRNRRALAKIAWRCSRGGL